MRLNNLNKSRFTTAIQLSGMIFYNTNLLNKLFYDIFDTF